LVDDEGVSLTCTCPAGSNGVVCWHMGAVGLMTHNLPEPVEGLKKLGKEEPQRKPVEDARPLRTSDFDISDILSGRYTEALTSGALGS
jgi:uncharacterized Zn finger protein